MKALKVIGIVAMATLSSVQAATLTFTNTGLGRVASGFGDSAGNIASGLIWGVVVDKSGNGFATSDWTASFTYTGGNTGGITLQTATGATDDILFLNGTVTSNLSTATDNAAANTGRVNSITTVTFGSLLAGGEKFAIIWFDRGIALGSTSVAGQKFGLATAGTNADPAFVLPTGNGATIDYSAAFTGADPLKTASFALVPETSTALLGALGALGLLRRRR